MIGTRGGLALSCAKIPCCTAGRGGVCEACVTPRGVVVIGARGGLALSCAKIPCCTAGRGGVCEACVTPRGVVVIGARGGLALSCVETLFCNDVVFVCVLFLFKFLFLHNN